MIGFLQPLALLALLAVPLAWALARLEARRRRAADAAYGGPPGLRPARRTALARLREALLLLALTALALAAARPTWGREQVPLVRRGIDVVIALDVSRSMTVTDVAPSRAGAAATGLARLLRALPGDRAGLVTFAGTALARSPLTHDLDVLALLIARAQGEAALLDPGTDLALAIETALATLDVEDAADTQVIVLVSDGEHVGRELDVALRRARDAGVRVYTVAAGTEAGGDLPAVPGRASTERARLERDTLERVAEATGGSVRELGSVAGLAVEFSRLRQTTFEGAEEEAATERFQWFIVAALVLLALHSLVPETSARRRAAGAPSRPRTHRRFGLASLAGLLALLLGACAGTAAWRAVDEGNRAHDAARYDDALAAYERAAGIAPPEDQAAIVYNRGNTLHRLRRFEEATTASARAVEEATTVALRNRARYALGNHAFRRGDLDGAREAYSAVLLSDPGDEDARHNLELVLALQQPPEPPPDAPAPGVTPGPGSTPPSGEQGQAQPGQSGQPGQPGGTPEAGTPSSGQAPPGAAPGPAPVEGAPLTEEEAQAALAAALAELGETATVEEALAVLDRLRALGAFQRIQGGRGPGSLPDH